MLIKNTADTYLDWRIHIKGATETPRVRRIKSALILASYLAVPLPVLALIAKLIVKLFDDIYSLYKTRRPSLTGRVYRGKTVLPFPIQKAAVSKKSAVLET